MEFLSPWWLTLLLCSLSDVGAGDDHEGGKCFWWSVRLYIQMAAAAGVGALCEVGQAWWQLPAAATTGLC